MCSQIVAQQDHCWWIAYKKGQSGLHRPLALVGSLEL